MSTTAHCLTLRPCLLVDASLGPKEKPELNLKTWEQGISSSVTKAMFIFVFLRK